MKGSQSRPEHSVPTSPTPPHPPPGPEAQDAVEETLFGSQAREGRYLIPFQAFLPLQVCCEEVFS